MNLCLDISAGLVQTAGIGRYVRELALSLQRQTSASGVTLSLFHNRQPDGQLPPELATLRRSSAPLGNKTWRFYLLAGLPLFPTWRAAIDGCDLFHGTDAILPRLRQPTVITIHDLTTHLFPQYHTRLNRLYLRWALPVMAQRTSAIIADSYATQRDIVAHLGVTADKVSVVHLGVDLARFSPQSAGAIQSALVRIGVYQPYVLAVGTLEPRKNLLTLLHAYAMLPRSAPPLVLVGGQGWGDNPLSVAIEQLGLKDRVHLTGYVADDLLPALYSGAEIFVYPSLYEGFGLPVLEAMACGAPVITSNASSLPEVAGDAAIQVDPRRADDLAEMLQHLLASPELRSRLSEAGMIRAQAFSWARCATETVAVYRRVLDRAA